MTVADDTIDRRANLGVAEIRPSASSRAAFAWSRAARACRLWVSQSPSTAALPRPKQLWPHRRQPGLWRWLRPLARSPARKRRFVSSGYERECRPPPRVVFPRRWTPSWPAPARSRLPGRSQRRRPDSPVWPPPRERLLLLWQARRGSRDRRWSPSKSPAFTCWLSTTATLTIKPGTLEEIVVILAPTNASSVVSTKRLDRPPRA